MIQHVNLDTFSLNISLDQVTNPLKYSSIKLHWILVTLLKWRFPITWVRWVSVLSVAK